MNMGYSFRGYNLECRDMAHHCLAMSCLRWQQKKKGCQALNGKTTLEVDSIDVNSQNGLYAGVRNLCHSTCPGLQNS